MANELITIPQETIDALDNIAEHSLDFWKEVKPFSRSVQIATAMNQLREMLSGPILKQFVALKDTPLGFMTDKGIKSIKSDAWSITRVDATESVSVDYKGIFEKEIESKRPYVARRLKEEYKTTTPRKGYVVVKVNKNDND